MVPLSSGREQSIWLSLPTVVAVVILLALMKLYVSAHTGLVLDESYYNFWSQRLAAGYLDHPPAVAWMIAAGRALFGDNELGVRVMAVVFGLGVSAALYRIGAILLDRRAAALAVLLYNLTPAAGLGFVTTPDPPSVMAWTAVLWAIAEFIGSKRAGWWLAAGIFAGLGLSSKYTDAFLAPGILVYLLTSRERRAWLKLWQLWAGAALALVVFAPVIWWNAGHGWASFRFQGQRTVTSGIDPNFLGNLGELIAGQALYMVPILLVLSIVGLVQYFRRRGDTRWQALALPAWTTLPALLYFIFHTLHARVEANWLIPFWPALTLVGAQAAIELWERRPRLSAGLVGAQMLIGLALSLTVYAQALWQPFDIGDLDRTNETRGWPQLQHQLAQLATANGARWIATSANFGVTGELATYFGFANSPLPVRQINEAVRWSFLPPLDPAALGWPALFVNITPTGQTPHVPSELFGSTKLLGVIARNGGRWPLESYSVFLVSQPTAAFMAGLAH